MFVARTLEVQGPGTPCQDFMSEASLGPDERTRARRNGCIRGGFAWTGETGHMATSSFHTIARSRACTHERYDVTDGDGTQTGDEIAWVDGHRVKGTMSIAQLLMCERFPLCFSVLAFVWLAGGGGRMKVDAREVHAMPGTLLRQTRRSVSLGAYSSEDTALLGGVCGHRNHAHRCGMRWDGRRWWRPSEELHVRPHQAVEKTLASQSDRGSRAQQNGSTR